MRGPLAVRPEGLTVSSLPRTLTVPSLPVRFCPRNRDEHPRAGSSGRDRGGRPSRALVERDDSYAPLARKVLKRHEAPNRGCDLENYVEL